MRRRFSVLVATFVLAVSACGGAGNPLSGAQGIGPDDVTRASDALVARWGSRGAFYAVVASLDAGYGAEQVIAHASDLAADGRIPGVDPEGSPSHLLTPVSDAIGAAVPGAAAAPLRLPSAFEGDQPQDQYVEFLGATAGEIYDAGQQTIVDKGFEAEVVWLTLQLASAGYTAAQITEGILLGHVVPGATADGAQCAGLIDDDLFLVLPDGASSRSFDCTTQFSLPPDSGPSSGSASPCMQEATFFPESGVDGSYEGTGTLIEVLQGFDVTDACVGATIAAGSVTMTVAYTASYAIRYENQDVVCRVTITDLYAGEGSVSGSTITASLDPQRRDVVAEDGPDCDTTYSTGTARDEALADFDRNTPGTFSGTISDGTITGIFGELIYMIATRS